MFPNPVDMYGRPIKEGDIICAIGTQKEDPLTGKDIRPENGGFRVEEEVEIMCYYYTPGKDTLRLYFKSRVSKKPHFVEAQVGGYDNETKFYNVFKYPKDYRWNFIDESNLYV